MTPGQYAIDRITGDLAQCENLEDGQQQQIKTALLPKGAKEGDLLDYDGTTLTLNKDATDARRKKIRGMMDQLFRR